MKILNSKFDGKCKACGATIAAGDRVRWSKADDTGTWTTCMACPHEPKAKSTTPANGTPATPITSAVMAALVTERDALLARLATAREAFREQRAEIASLTSERDVAAAMLLTVITERDAAWRELAALRADRRVGPLAQLPPEARTDWQSPQRDADVDADDDCPI